MSEKIKRFSVRNTSIYPEGMGPGPDFSTLMVRADDHDVALAAKDARIAELEGLLREWAAMFEAGIASGPLMRLRDRTAESLASQQQADPKGCTKPGCFPYCDCGTIDDHVPPAATPSEDGGEVPTVVGWLQTDATRNPAMWVSRHRQVSERAIDEGALAEPLMTVAQCKRIVAAKDAEIARLKDLAIAGADTVIEMAAQPARQVGGDERTYEQGIQAAFDLVKFAACNTDIEQFASRLHDLADDIIEEAPTYKAQWKDIGKLCAEIAELKSAALAPAAVVMPERSNERGSDGELTYEAKAWNACLERFEELNRGGK